MGALDGKRILLTGAAGGLGSVIAKQLHEEGALLGLVGRSAAKLQQLVDSLQVDSGSKDGSHCVIEGDLNTIEGRQHVLAQMRKHFSRKGDNGIDILINNAGVNDFTPFINQSDDRLMQTLQTNVIAPMSLSKEVVKDFIDRDQGHIVNIGSTFGSIGFAWFVSYSTSKYALRGFSEALRRELEGYQSHVDVTYIAPRAIRTALNSQSVYEMADAVKMNIDAPEKVAGKIIQSIIKRKKEVYIGFPESLFVRINQLFPRLVDKALAGQNKIMRRFTKDNINETAAG